MKFFILIVIIFRNYFTISQYISWKITKTNRKIFVFISQFDTIYISWKNKQIRIEGLLKFSIWNFLFCLKYFSKNHTMVIFEINTLKSKKIPPSVITKYSSRRREYLVMTRGGIFLLWSVFIKIFIEWWTRKTPRRQPRCFSCTHEMNIV